MAFRSVTDLTWKDAAVIEVRSLIARLKDNAGKAQAAASLCLASPITQTDLERVTRQAVKLAEIIDHIEEKPRRRAARKGVKR